MVAPAGVNEELPQEPAKAGRAGAGTAEAEPSQAEETQEKAASVAVVPAEVVPKQAEPAVVPKQAEPAVVPPQAEPAEEERAAAGPADATSAGAEPAEARSSEAEPAEAEPAEAGAARKDPVDAEPAEAEPADGGPADGGPAEAGPAEAGAAEAASVKAGEADWDAGEGSRDVSSLAVAGIILGVIALVGVAVGVLAVITHGFRPKTVVTYRPAAVFALRPGQCVNSGSDALKFTVVSCTRPHDAEVFAAFALPAAPWPGASAVRVDAGDGCASRLDSYIDPQLATASLTQEYVYPNQAAWQAGERTVVCEVSAVSGRLTGSVRAQG
jgi:Septum formation